MNGIQRFRLSMVTAVLALIGLCSGAVADEKLDPIGTWNLKVSRPGRPVQESILKLQKNGEQLVGVVTDSQGRMGTIKDAQLKGSDLSFRVEAERDGQKFSFAYTAKLTADAMKGTASGKVIGRDLKFDFAGTRIKETGSIAGSWKLALAMAAGRRGQGAGARPAGKGPRPGAGGGAGGRGRQGAALTRQIMLNLKEEGGKITGDFVGFSGKPASIQDVKFKDGELSFKVPQEMGPTKVTISFVAKPVGDKIQGIAKIQMPFGVREIPFQGDRLKTTMANAVGTWRLHVVLKDGPTVEPTLRLAQSGTSLKGVYVGEHGETPIENALLFGDEITFDVARDQNGKKYRLHYQGKVKADTLSGTVDYDFDGIVGYVTFEGKRTGASQASTETVH
jgi:hypothetical protein